MNDHDQGLPCISKGWLSSQREVCSGAEGDTTAHLCLADEPELEGGKQCQVCGSERQSRHKQCAKHCEQVLQLGKTQC